MTLLDVEREFPLEEPVKFEDEFQRLEEILARLEGGDLSLDASLKQYEKGVKALRNCRKILSKAERTIEELSPSVELSPEGEAGVELGAEADPALADTP